MIRDPLLAVREPTGAVARSLGFGGYSVQLIWRNIKGSRDTQAIPYPHQTCREDRRGSTDEPQAARGRFTPHLRRQRNVPALTRLAGAPVDQMARLDKNSYRSISVNQ